MRKAKERDWSFWCGASLRFMPRHDRSSLVMQPDPVVGMFWSR